MIMFIIGEGRTAESRRVANALGGSYERLTHVELLGDFTRGLVLAKRPSTIIVDASTAGLGTTRALREWLRHVVRYGKVHGVLKNQLMFTIDTPNIIVTSDKVTQALDIRTELPYAEIINTGPRHVDTRTRVLGVPMQTTRPNLIHGSLDRSDAAFLVRMDLVDHVAGRATELLMAELVRAAESACLDLSGLLRDQPCDPSDGSFKYDGQSAHELQAILQKVTSYDVPNA